MVGVTLAVGWLRHFWGLVTFPCWVQPKCGLPFHQKKDPHLVGPVHMSETCLFPHVPHTKKEDMWTGLPSTIIHTYRIYQPCYPIRSNQIKPRFLDPRFLTLRAAASFLSGPTRQEKQSLAEGRGAWRISGWWFSPTLLKNMSSSIGIMTFPTEWKNNPNVPKPPTRYIGNIMEIYLENNGNIMRISI